MCRSRWTRDCTFRRRIDSQFASSLVAVNSPNGMGWPALLAVMEAEVISEPFKRIDGQV